MQLFDYHSPHTRLLKTNGFKYPKKNRPTEDSVSFINNLFISDNHVHRHVYKKLIEINPMLPIYITKPAGIIYGYYLEFPERFNHEPDNIVGHIYKACHDAMMSFAKLNNILDDKYYKMDYKLCVKNKDKILSTLHNEGKRVQTFRYFSTIDYKNYEPEGTQ